MDGKFTCFPNAGCNELELANAGSGPCLAAEEGKALDGHDANGELIGDDTPDRTGIATPKPPDWKFVADVDFNKPLSAFAMLINARAYASDGYLIDTSGF